MWAAFGHLRLCGIQETYVPKFGQCPPHKYSSDYERDRVTFVMEGHQSNKYVFKLKLNNPFQSVVAASLQIHVFDSTLCLHPRVLLTLPWIRCTTHAPLFTYGLLCLLLPN